MKREMVTILAAISVFAATKSFAQCTEPFEVQQLSVSKTGTAAVFQWDLPGSASASELVRGDLRTGKVNVIGVGQTCLGTDLSAQPATYTENVNPPSGFGFWYLVRATNECGKGSWGAGQEAGTSVARITECGCHPDFATPNRYVASEFTVSDRRTCLEWEKKSGNTGDPLHSYTAQTNFYALQLNTPGPGWVSRVNTEGFAGHSDWRLPKSSGPLAQPTGQPPELESLLMVPCPGGDYPNLVLCIDPIFGFIPNNAGPSCDPIYNNCIGPSYWSGTTVVGSPTAAWTINFFDGSWDSVNSKRYSQWSFRAVRGTLYGE